MRTGKLNLLAFAGAATLMLAGASAHAGIITQWNFNSTTPDANVATGVLTPSVGSGTAALIGGTTSTFATGSPGDTAGGTDNSALNVSTFKAQGTGSGTAGVQYNVSTVGQTGQVQITLDFRQSGTISRYFQLLVSSDGTTFAAPSGGTAVVAGPDNSNTAVAFTSTGIYSANPGSGSQTFEQNLTYTLPAGSAFENNASFAFQWVAIFDQSGTAPGNYISANAGTSAAYGTTGTARFDQVTVSAVPEPTALALLAPAGLLLARRRRFAAKA